MAEQTNEQQPNYGYLMDTLNNPWNPSLQVVAFLRRKGIDIIADEKPVARPHPPEGLITILATPKAERIFRDILHDYRFGAIDAVSNPTLSFEEAKRKLNRCLEFCFLREDEKEIPKKLRAYYWENRAKYLDDHLTQRAIREKLQSRPAQPEPQKETRDEDIETERFPEDTNPLAKEAEKARNKAREYSDDKAQPYILKILEKLVDQAVPHAN